MSGMIEIVLYGDLIVTMGKAGELVYDSQRGVIAHIGLTDEARVICRTYLPASRINSIGDHYVANLTVAMKSSALAGQESSRCI